MSEEAKTKIGNAHRGKIVSEETRNKIRNAAKAQHEKKRLEQQSGNPNE